jgi:hypothetical protein
VPVALIGRDRSAGAFKCARHDAGRLVGSLGC